MKFGKTLLVMIIVLFVCYMFVPACFCEDSDYADEESVISASAELAEGPGAFSAGFEDDVWMIADLFGRD